MSYACSLLMAALLANPTPSAATACRRGPAPPRSFLDHQRYIDVFDGAVRSVAFSPDGKVLAAGGNRFVTLFDARTGERLKRLEGHTGVVHHVTYFQDGDLLASGSDDKSIRLWDTNSGKLVKVLKGGGDGKNHVHLLDLPVRCVAFFPDGKTLASCGTNNYVTMWDVASGLWELKVWTNHADKGYRDGCYHLAITSDGKHCAVAGGVCPPRVTRQVSLFTVDHGLKPLWNREHEGNLAATHVAFSTDGAKLLSCGHDNAVRVWDVKAGQLLHKLLGPDGSKVMQAALFSPDGKRIVAVTREGALRVWLAAEGKLLASVKASDKGVLGLALSRDGRMLATCGEDQTIQLWDLSTQRNDKQ